MGDDDVLFSVEDDNFPYHVSPFPDLPEIDLSDRRRLLHPPPPPQKLRPIRSLDRPSSPPPANHGGGPLGEFKVVGVACDNGSSQKLELVGRQVESCDHVSAHDMNVNGQKQKKKKKQESCSSWDIDDDDLSASLEERGSGTKREKEMTKFETFLDNLAKKVMDKQEQMHKQLLDMIEKKERERVLREEAWKQKEMERIKKDEEARAQEKANNLAMLSLIQNLLGHEIQIPQPAATNSREEDKSEAKVQNDLKSDQSISRWLEAEVESLVTLRTSQEPRFRGTKSKSPLWEEISKAMHSMGYNRSAKRCKEKWDNINKYYKRTLESGKKPRLNSKACPYFDELDNLYRNRLPNTIGNALSDASMSSKIEKEQE